MLFQVPVTSKIFWVRPRNRYWGTATSVPTVGVPDIRKMLWVVLAENRGKKMKKLPQEFAAKMLQN